MANLRIVTDNAVGRAASLIASSAAGGLVAAQLAEDRKSSVWRGTGKTERLTVRWDDAEEVGAVALPFCNLSPTARIRVRVSSEPAATNLRTWSEAFDNAAWTKSAATVVANAGTAPDGSTTADRLVATTASGVHYLQQSIGSVAVGDVRTESVFVRQDTGEPFVRLLLGTGFASSGAYFDLAAGEVGVATNCTAAMVAHADGWYRCTVTATATSAGTSSIQIQTHRTGAGAAYAGNGTAGILVWGAMGVRGASTGSYVPSGAAVGTRAPGYIDGWQSYDYDSGLVLACPAPAIRLRGFTPAQAASAYAYGGGACARHWLPANMMARGLAIDISDPDNLQGYIEAACLVAGPVWSPVYNASAASVTVVDRTELTRGAGGDQLADPGTISRRVPVDLRALTDEDRATFLKLVRNSRAHPILLSVFPGHADVALERDHAVYGRRTKDSDIAYQFMGRYATTLEVEEI